MLHCYIFAYPNGLSLSLDISQFAKNRFRKLKASLFFQARLWNSTFLEEFKNIDLVKVRTTAELSSTLPNIRITSEEASSTVSALRWPI